MSENTSTLTRPTSIIGLPSHALRRANSSKAVLKPTTQPMPRPAPQAASLAQARTQANTSSKQAYTGAELKPYQGRPGSLDFLALAALAALMGSRRVCRSDQAELATKLASK